MFKSKRPPEFQTVIVKVDMRTESCSKKVVKCLQAMENVEEYDVNLAEKKVTVTGRVDPKKLVKRLERKSGRHAELWTERSLASLSSRKSWRYRLVTTIMYNLN
ncbi:hypothetical protein GOP47_0011449 [Adiantum capillus-veneris]|uniref:HMA domain-containing protein n=1 Tax=Adiantum capillus-veneris TaxID=13818 RepID=A0A9D4ZHV8_ADICA|nr:hypothetical protein GOP47_0011449 [Adiantum capillus-veneris]